MEIRTIGYANFLIFIDGKMDLESTLNKMSNFIKQDAGEQEFLIIDARINPHGLISRTDMANKFGKNYTGYYTKTFGNPFRGEGYNEDKFYTYLQSKQEEITRIIGNLSTIPIIYFMCCEKDASECHRTVIAQFLKNKGFSVKFEPISAKKAEAIKSSKLIDFI